MLWESPTILKKRLDSVILFACQAFQLVSLFPNEEANYAEFLSHEIYVTEFKCRRFDRSL